jgi:hypothetical protein
MRRAIGIGLFVAALARPAFAQTEPPAAPPAAPSGVGMRELLDAAQATAKATRENLDYARVTPDLLYQILSKLDKIETKLDKIEDAVKRDTARSRR